MSIVTPKEIRHGLIMKRVQDHYDEALKYFPEEQIVGVFLQGSQNYELDSYILDLIIIAIICLIISVLVPKSVEYIIWKLSVNRI